MPDQISQENEAYIQASLSSGVFRDRGEMLNKALDLLRSRDDLVARLAESTRQLRDGDSTSLDDSSLQAFLEDVNARGHQRYAASKRSG